MLSRLTGLSSGADHQAYAQGEADLCDNFYPESHNNEYAANKSLISYGPSLWPSQL
jgi:hypothetical protein